MPKGYLMDTGLRNALLRNFMPINQRMDKDELWEQTVFRMLTDRFGYDEIKFWRTTDGKEIDFILSDENPPLAIEAKFDERMAKIKKYRLFLETYPEFKFQFGTLHPWSEDFFRRFM